MSKYVREIDSIQQLRDTPTSDAAAAHVRTPTGQSGVFVPMSADPFGNGDDGAVALKATDGTWWVRKAAIQKQPVTPGWWAHLSDTKALNSALEFAGEGSGEGPRTIQIEDRYVVSESDTANTNGIVEIGNGIDVTGGGEIALKDNDDPTIPVVWIRDIDVAERVGADLAVNGNSSGQSTSVTCVEVSRVQGTDPALHLHCRNGDIGVRISDQVEGAEIHCYLQDCVTGVDYGDSSDTPDENTVFIHGKDCETFFHGRKGGNTGTLVFGTEQGEIGASIEGGSYSILGEIRSTSGPAVLLPDTGQLPSVSFGAPVITGCTQGIVVESCRSISGTVLTKTVEEESLKIGNIENQSRLSATITQPGAGASGTTNAVQLGTSASTLFNFHLSVSIGPVESGGDAILVESATGISIEAGIPSSETVNFSGVGGIDIKLNTATSGIPEFVNPSTPSKANIRLGTINDSDRSNIIGLVEGMAIEYNPDDGLPNYYNGTDWVLPDGTTT
jgi:hypothetical protein